MHTPKKNLSRGILAKKLVITGLSMSYEEIRKKKIRQYLINLNHGQSRTERSVGGEAVDGRDRKDPTNLELRSATAFVGEALEQTAVQGHR